MCLTGKHTEVWTKGRHTLLAPFWYFFSPTVMEVPPLEFSGWFWSQVVLLSVWGAHGGAMKGKMSPEVQPRKHIALAQPASGRPTGRVLPGQLCLERSAVALLSS